MRKNLNRNNNVAKDDKVIARVSSQFKLELIDAAAIVGESMSEFVRGSLQSSVFEVKRQLLDYDIRRIGVVTETIEEFDSWVMKYGMNMYKGENLEFKPVTTLECICNNPNLTECLILNPDNIELNGIYEIANKRIERIKNYSIK